MEIQKRPISNNNPGVAITPSLFVWHSTDNQNVDAESHFRYWNDSYVGTSTNYVLDWNEILELIQPGMESWNCGSKGNPISIACEICQSDSPQDFLNSMKNAQFLWREIRKTFPDLQPVSHNWVTENLGGTTHIDPIPYLQSHGWTWQMFLDYINEAEGANIIVDQWKQDIMDKADQAGLLDKTQHNADDNAPNWFIAAVALRLKDLIDKKG